jgi:hypothetical protein
MLQDLAGVLPWFSVLCGLLAATFRLGGLVTAVRTLTKCVEKVEAATAEDRAHLAETDGVAHEALRQAVAIGNEKDELEDELTALRVDLAGDLGELKADVRNLTLLVRNGGPKRDDVTA